MVQREETRGSDQRKTGESPEYVQALIYSKSDCTLSDESSSYSTRDHSKWMSKLNGLGNGSMRRMSKDCRTIGKSIEHHGRI